MILNSTIVQILNKIKRASFANIVHVICIHQLCKDLPDPCSVEEGESIMSRYKNVGPSWLCSKLHLPDKAALKVREFLRPQPIFFLESGAI